MVSPSLSALGACLVLAAALPGAVSAQPAGVEPRADAVLRSMTEYVSGLRKFSVTTENTLEVVTTEGQKIQFTAPATMTVARPNKLVAQRRGDIVDQIQRAADATGPVQPDAAQLLSQGGRFRRQLHGSSRQEGAVI